MQPFSRTLLILKLDTEMPRELGIMVVCAHSQPSIMILKHPRRRAKMSMWSSFENCYDIFQKFFKTVSAFRFVDQEMLSPIYLQSLSGRSRYPCEQLQIKFRSMFQTWRNGIMLVCTLLKSWNTMGHIKGDSVTSNNKKKWHNGNIILCIHSLLSINGAKTTENILRDLKQYTVTIWQLFGSF